MKTIKTDSLGIEILSSISIEETGKAIKPVENKDEALKDKVQDEVILFEVYEQEKIVGYFTLGVKNYEQWVTEYKIEGVEI